MLSQDCPRGQGTPSSLLGNILSGREPILQSRSKGIMPMTRVVKSLLFASLLSAFSGTAAHAQTIHAATCNSSDVQAALNSVSVDGSTVIIPAGTCTWTTAVSYNQVFSTTILGAGNQTTVGGGD